MYISWACFYVSSVKKELTHHLLLAELPVITRSEGRVPVVKDAMKHHTKTTPGISVAIRLQRFPLDRFIASCKQFEMMVQLSTMYLSSSSLVWFLRVMVTGFCAGIIECSMGLYSPSPTVCGKKTSPKSALSELSTTIRASEEDIDKTGIATPIGLFESPYMIFGLRTAAVYLVDKVILGHNFCHLCMVDILVLSIDEAPEAHSHSISTS